MEELISMAKAHTIDDVINSIMANYQTLLTEAVVHTKKQAEKDMKQKAINVLVKHYYGGYNPSSYYRTGALIQSITSYSHVSMKGDKIRCDVIVEYSPELLDAYLSGFDYAYKSSKKYGTPDPEWIIQNFWEGKHPYTDGSRDPEEAQKSFGYHQSGTTQNQGMMATDETGPSLKRYAFAIFPDKVMAYMLSKGSKI